MNIDDVNETCIESNGVITVDYLTGRWFQPVCTSLALQAGRMRVQRLIFTEFDWHEVPRSDLLMATLVSTQDRFTGITNGLGFHHTSNIDSSGNCDGLQYSMHDCN
jgi:hypothetical protein